MFIIDCESEREGGTDEDLPREGGGVAVLGGVVCRVFVWLRLTFVDCAVPLVLLLFKCRGGDGLRGVEMFLGEIEGGLWRDARGDARATGGDVAGGLCGVCAGGMGEVVVWLA